MIIKTLVIGPVSTNCYILVDPHTNEAVVIDPAWDGAGIFNLAGKQGWKIKQVWYTHAHFDHFAGTAELVHLLGYLPSLALHAADSGLWQDGGGSSSFGIGFDQVPLPALDLSREPLLSLGENLLRVVHVPGHSPGSCMFYCASEKVVFTGDLIFRRSVGRTDLPGGDWEALQTSIKKKVFTLPAETRILPGHGEATTVLEEKEGNPYVHV